MDISYVVEIVKDHVSDDKVVEVLSFFSEPAVGKGDNYCSEIRRVTLQVAHESGKKSTKSLIVKSLPLSEPHKNYIQKTGAFVKEVKIYTKVLKQMELLMEQYNDPSEKLWCDLIGHRKSQVIMLEDLQIDGYKVTSRQEMMDYNHAIVSVENLARFHAMSKVLLAQNAVPKSDLKAYVFFQDDESISASFVKSVEKMSEVVKYEWGPEWEPYSGKLKNMASTMISKMQRLGDVNESRFNIINHGDFWTSNIMFKYDANNKPTSVRFVDFQFTYYNSFAWDLTYFLYNSVKGSVRRENYVDIVEYYCKILCRTLEFYGIAEFPSIESIKQEMERLRYFGLVLLCSITAMMTAEPESAMDMERRIEMSDAIDSAKIYSKESYMKNVQQDLIDCSKIGLL